MATVTVYGHTGVSIDSSGSSGVSSTVYPDGVNWTLTGTSANVNVTNPIIGTASPGTAATSSVDVGAIYNSSAPTLTNGQQASLQLDSSGNLNVNVKAGGSATANGTYNSSLPTVTSGNTVSLQTDVNGRLIVTLPQTSGSVSGGTPASNSSASGGIYNSTPVTLTNGQQAAIQLDASGNLNVNVKAGISATSNGTYNSSLPTLTSGNTVSFQTDVNGRLIVVESNPVGSASIATNQVSVTNSATQIVAARTGSPGTGRVSVTVFNNGSVPFYLGTSGVTTSTGIPVLASGSVTIPTTAAIYGITSSGTVTVGVLENF